MLGLLPNINSQEIKYFLTNYATQPYLKNGKYNRCTRVNNICSSIVECSINNPYKNKEYRTEEDNTKVHISELKCIFEVLEANQSIYFLCCVNRQVTTHFIVGGRQHQNTLFQIQYGVL